MTTTAPAVPQAPVAPKAPTKAEQKKIDADAAKAKKAQEKAAKEAAAKVAAAEKTETVSQNGVSRPASGKTKLVWDIADSMSATAKAPVERKALTDVLLAEPHNLVVGTIHTQYGKWRKFHGLAKPVVAKEAPAAPEAPAATPEGEAAE